MAKPRAHLSRAPIAEAILDFRVEPRSDLKAKELEELADEFKLGYPDQGELREIEGMAQFGPAEARAFVKQQEPSGRLLRNSGGSVVQLRAGGVTFSKLKPYSSWVEIFPEVQDLWARYLRMVRPVRLKRAAVRYINDMVLPYGKPSNYLTNAPTVAPPMPQIAREFLSRVVLWDQERNVTAIVIQALGPQLDPDRTRLLLDIDVFREGDLDMRLDGFAGLMDPLRDLKNVIFFASISEEAAAHFA